MYALQLARRVSAQIDVERKVRCDELTNLPNRLALFEALEKAFARLTRLGEAFALLYIDLDDFKGVNDRYGHAAGDKLLVQFAQRLKDCARNVDLVARLSGDEFAIVVTGAADAAAATALANRIVSSLDSSFLIEGANISTGACIGIALAPEDGATSELLLKSADEALYDAKRRSGGVIQLHDSGHRDTTRRRHALERDLRNAFRSGEFFLVYQPIFHLDTNEIVACEALLRWRHPTFGVKLPIEFMQTMEETGLINEVGQWILTEACRAAIAWPQSVRVAVNVSAVQLRKADILPFVVSTLNVTTLPAARLEIEITETAVIDDDEQILSNLRALRQLGVRIALDDFGTGYSSLTYLRRLSPDSIKIDGSFIGGLTADADCRSIVRSLIGLSRDLSLKVVAEGIESDQQLHFLRRHNCDEGQGNYLCAPGSEQELAVVLRNINVAKINAA